MRQFLLNDKLFLLLAYLAPALVVLYLLPEDAGLLAEASLLILLLLVLVLSYEPLLERIRQFRGHQPRIPELQFFDAFVALNRQVHKYREAGEVLALVEQTLHERIKVGGTVLLINALFLRGGEEAGQRVLEEGWLETWPGRDGEPPFWSEELLRAVLKRERVFSVDEVAEPLRQVFTATGTSLAVPVIQDGRLLCLILLGRGPGQAPYSDFERQMFDYLANQLALVLDRIRAYEQIMRKTALDHAEKMQVMEGLSANIAHEMRTPLSGIRASIIGIEGYMDDLLAAYEHAGQLEAERFPPIRANHVQALRDTPRRITLMIDQAHTVIDMLLMNLRDTSLDRRQFTACSAAACVRQAIERYPFKSGERDKLRLRLEQDFRFLGIEVLFVYVLFNLLKNALYSLRSAQKGDIEIRLARGEGANCLHFRDTGEGIDEAVRQRLFESFFTTKAEGTGAGLAFCRRTLRSFGGDIRCESRQGEYAEFILSLPPAPSSGLELELLSSRP